MQEVWKPVPLEPFVMIEASNLGRIRRVSYRRNFPSGRILKPRLGKHGYLYLNFYLGKDRGHKSCTVHRLVASAFIGLPGAGDSVNHKNFDRLDNRPENLEWVSLAENTAHQHAHGRGPVGKACWNCKADPEIVHEMLKDGATLTAIGKRFGVKASAVHGMRKRYRKRGEWHV